MITDSTRSTREKSTITGCASTSSSTSSPMNQRHRKRRRILTTKTTTRRRNVIFIYFVCTIIIIIMLIFGSIETTTTKYSIVSASVPASVSSSSSASSVSLPISSSVSDTASQTETKTVPVSKTTTSTSRRRHANNRSNNNKIIITWINGIGYNYTHMIDEEKLISKYFGYSKIYFYHNPTAMNNEYDIYGYINDFKQATQQKFIGLITNEVYHLIQHLKSSIQLLNNNNNGNNGGGHIIHIAHSQGVLITSLAISHSLKYIQQQEQNTNTNTTNTTANNNTTDNTNLVYLTKDEMKQIEIICFGGAAVIRKTIHTPFKRCINYYSINDPLLYIVPEAVSALRTGFTSSSTSIIVNSGSQQEQEDNTNTITHDNEEFCFLAPRGGDPLIDHQLNGPTYSVALQWEGIRYQQLYLNVFQRYYIHYIVLLVLQPFQTIIESKIQSIVQFFILHPIIVIINFIQQQLLKFYNILQKFIQQYIQQPLLLFLLILRECCIYIFNFGHRPEHYIPITTNTTSATTTGSK